MIYSQTKVRSVHSIFFHLNLPYFFVCFVKMAYRLLPKEEPNCSYVKLSSKEPKKFSKKSYEEFKFGRLLEVLSRGTEQANDSNPDILAKFVGEKHATTGTQTATLWNRESPDGLMSAVLESYKNSWTLSTSPKHWWLHFVQKISSAINKNYRKESVRRFFNDIYEDPKITEIEVGNNYVNDIEWNWLFDFLNTKETLSKMLKTAQLLEVLAPSFSKTNPLQQAMFLVSLLSTPKKSATLATAPEGSIPSMYLVGTHQDWCLLSKNSMKVKEILEPIHGELGLTEEWWNTVKQIFENFLRAYDGKPDLEWWSRIITTDPECRETKEINGWITALIDGEIVGEMFYAGNGLSEKPIILKTPSDVSREGVLVSGIAGFWVAPELEVPTIEPRQGWGLLLNDNSCSNEER